ACRAVGGAAARRGGNAGMPRRRHADEVDVEFDGGVHNRFHDVAGSKDDPREGSRRHGTERRRRLADVKEIDRDIRAGQKSSEALNGFEGAAGWGGESDRNQQPRELDVATDLIDEAARTRRDEQRRDGERRNTASATDPCSQCATPSRPWVASTTRSLPCSLRKSTMAWVGSCNLMLMLSTSIPSLLAIIHGGSSSSESPPCASRRPACRNATASPRP